MLLDPNFIPFIVLSLAVHIKLFCVIILVEPFDFVMCHTMDHCPTIIRFKLFDMSDVKQKLIGYVHVESYTYIYNMVAYVTMANNSDRLNQ